MEMTRRGMHDHKVGPLRKQRLVPRPRRRLHNKLLERRSRKPGTRKQYRFRLRKINLPK